MPFNFSILTSKQKTITPRPRRAIFIPFIKQRFPERFSLKICFITYMKNSEIEKYKARK